MEIHIGNRVADVSLVNKEGNKVQLTIDGKPYEVDIVMAENGSCSILHEGNSYNAELIQKESKKSYDVNIFYRSYRIDIVDTQAKYLRMKKGDDTRQDDKIIALYWARKEEAISETDRKYGSYCRSISFRILNDKEDSEECVNDTWLHTWNAIPPGKPEFLAGFLGKIVRNLSISKYRAGHAQKRGSGETQALLDELEECIPSGKSVEDEIEGRETAAAINRFLETLDAESRKIFVRRYFWAEPVKELAGNLNISEGKVKSQLFRMRAKLKMHLEKEEIAL